MLATDDGGGEMVGGGDEFGGLGDAQCGVDDDSARDFADTAGVSCGEEGVICYDGADAGEDGIGASADAVDGCSTLFVGYPLAVAGACCDFAIEGLRPFYDDPGEVFCCYFYERVGESGCFFTWNEVDLDVCIAEFCDASAFGITACDSVWVTTGDNDSFNSCVYECARAGRCFAVVVAGFEGDVCGCVFGVIVIVFAIVECVDFCVRAAEVLVVAAAEDLVCLGVDDNAADGRIGFYA